MTYIDFVQWSCCHHTKVVKNICHHIFVDQIKAKLALHSFTPVNNELNQQKNADSVPINSAITSVFSTGGGILIGVCIE